MGPPTIAPPPSGKEEEEEEEDDYMKMTFTEDAPPQPETSLQRRRRLKREGEIRAQVKSKAQLVAEESQKREAGLAQSMLDQPAAKKSKGLAMMARMGFTGGALGARDNVTASSEPIRIAIKEDRGGIGADAEKKRKLREAAEAAGAEAKRVKVEEGEFRERVRREREVARLERQVDAAQKVAERMEEKKGGGDEVGNSDEARNGERREKQTSSQPLKSVNVLWRGLVRSREEAERDRRMRYDLEQSLSRLPTYEDDLEDEDDKKAMGKTKTVYVAAEDLDEEDPELEEFNALDVAEKLRRLVEFLRKEFNYCFWCKFTYPDATMEDCPGITEEAHD